MIDRLKKIDEDSLDEDIGKTIRLGTLLTLLAVPEVVSASDIRAHMQMTERPTAETVTNAINRLDTAKKTYSGFTAIQAANIIARTLYMEARGEGKEGIDAVASVLLNRAGAKSDLLPSVCFKKSQFRCWDYTDKKDPKTYKIVIPKNAVANGKDKDAWLYCQEVAGKLIRDKFASTIGNRNSYHTAAVSPSWSSSMKDKKTIGNHVFGYLSDQDGSLIKTKNKTYVVKNGDTLSSIASKNSTTVAKLLSLNPPLKKNPNKIRPGLKLMLP